MTGIVWTGGECPAVNEIDEFFKLYFSSYPEKTETNAADSAFNHSHVPDATIATYASIASGTSNNSQALDSQDILKNNSCNHYNSDSSPDFSQLTHFCADSGFDFFLNWKKTSSLKEASNAEPQFLAGDFDSSMLHSQKEAENLRKITYSSDKDFSDTELAIKNAQKILEKNSKIILIGGANGRFDHYLSNYELFSTKLRPDIWLIPGTSLFYLEKNRKYSISKFHENQNISFSRPAGMWGKGKIISEGLEWEGSLFRKNMVASLSNRPSKKAFEKGEIKIRTSQCPFILMTEGILKVTEI